MKLNTEAEIREDSEVDTDLQTWTQRGIFTFESVNSDQRFHVSPPELNSW